ncbi:glycosyltransferase family 4 protein, partial [Enterobacter ludwigii]
FTPKINIYSSLVSYFFPRVKVVNNIAGLGTAFINEGMKKKLLSNLYKISQKRADFVFFQNNEDHNYFVKEKIVCEAKTKRILGSGVNLEFFKPTKITKEEHIKFLLVARLIEQKGIRLYAEAAKIIKEKYPHVKFSLLGPIITNNPFAIDEREINNWEELGVVEYLGHSDNVAEVLIGYDCVVLPSFYREGVPKSLLEAAASGKIIITTDNIGCRDAVIDGVTGFLCKPKSLESLLEAFYKVLQLDYNSFIKMKIDARKLAQEKFDENIIIEEYLKTASN